MRVQWILRDDGIEYDVGVVELPTPQQIAAMDQRTRDKFCWDAFKEIVTRIRAHVELR